MHLSVVCPTSPTHLGEMGELMMGDLMDFVFWPIYYGLGCNYRVLRKFPHPCPYPPCLIAPVFIVVQCHIGQTNIDFQSFWLVHVLTNARPLGPGFKDNSPMIATSMACPRKDRWGILLIGALIYFNVISAADSEQKFMQYKFMRPVLDSHNSHK